MELIDTHCHLTFGQLAEDVGNVLARSRDAGVTEWITVGTETQQNQKTIELAGRFENMYATVGIHPHEAKNVDAQRLRELKKDCSIVGIRLVDNSSKKTILEIDLWGDKSWFTAIVGSDEEQEEWNERKKKYFESRK